MATEAGTRTRLDPEVFRLPVDKIREGHYTDAYFNFTRQLLVDLNHRPAVTLQVFQKQHSVLGGIDEAIAVLKLCSDDWSALEVHALHEGDQIEPWEPVLQVDGDYALFVHLETVYLGTLARRTRIMRNVREVVEAANGKPILFFPARHDHWLVQTGDGWAAHVAGAIGVSTDAQASWWGGRGVGTVPHGLIAAFGGDTVAAARAWADRYADEMNVTVLVDFENDSVRTALEVADALGEQAVGRAPRHLRAAGGPLPLARDGRLQADRCEPRAGREGAPRSGRGGPQRRAHRRLRRVRRGEDPPLRERWARRWTPTVSDPRSCRARTTSPRTWSGSRDATAQRPGDASGRTRG